MGQEVSWPSSSSRKSYADDMHFLQVDQISPVGRLTSILVSRFMLNLQEVMKTCSTLESFEVSQAETVVFRRVIGSLAESIRCGEESDETRRDDIEIESRSSAEEVESSDTSVKSDAGGDSDST